MIELINVSKYYPTEFGRHYVFRDVSLKLPLDKSVGVIGPNSAGKSTFLRLLGGADIPSEGKILRSGRISPPMGLTPGLQASLNAAENARFAGRIYGMERDEIADLIEYVRETANIGKFFDMPVGTYSAGMKQRVAFAINMSMTFDYYLFDEIGAGGDREFRKTGKAMVQERLKTSKFIIASHRTDELLDLCESGIVIRDGTLTFFDDIKDALAVYNTEDDDEDGVDREAKRAERRARKAEANGVTAEAKSERKAKRQSRKALKSETPAEPQADTQTTDAQSADALPTPDVMSADAEASAAAADAALRDGKRRERRERKAAAAKPALAEPAPQDAAPEFAAPDSIATADEATLPEATVPEDREARRAKRRVRKGKDIAQPVTIDAAITAEEPPAELQHLEPARLRRKPRGEEAIDAAPSAATGEAAEPAESRADLRARRALLREARLKARATDETPVVTDNDTPGTADPLPPRKPRLRGDEAWQPPPAADDGQTNSAKPRDGT